MNNEIEDFTGWLEILSLANSSYKDSQYDFNNQEKDSLINFEPKLDGFIFNIGQSLSIEHGYLEILVETYKRKIFDNETVLDITNIMANRIIKYTIQNHSYKEIEDLNNEEIIKWFLPTYERISKNLYSDKNSIEELVNLLKSLGSNEIKLEYKNENPFLAK